MPCVVFKFGETTAFVKLSGRTSRARCRFCKQRLAEKLCDWPTNKFENGVIKTCDAPMCEQCATDVGPELDYCPRHATADRAPKQARLFR